MAFSSNGFRALAHCWRGLQTASRHRSPSTLQDYSAQNLARLPLPSLKSFQGNLATDAHQIESFLPLAVRQVAKSWNSAKNSRQEWTGLVHFSAKNGFTTHAQSKMPSLLPSCRPTEKLLPVGVASFQHAPRLMGRLLNGRASSNPGQAYSTTSWTDRMQQQVREAVQKLRSPGKSLSPPASVKGPPAALKAAAGVMEKAGGKSTMEALLRKQKAALGRLGSQYRDAAALQVEAFWRRNYPIILGVVAIFLVMLLWRIMFGVASTFISFSEGMAKYGFLALASAIVAFTGLYLRARYTINPDAVYRQTMRMLQVNAKVLEVMGAPLSGSHVRAYVMSGGGLRIKNYRLGLSSKRCFLIFPIRGAEGRGLVSAEIKRKSGKYDFKLLAVDVATSASDSSNQQRIFVIGDEQTYVESGGVVAELRDPVVRALAKQKDYDAEDDREAEEAARLEREERVRKAVEREEAAEREAAAERERRLAEAQKN